MKVDRWADAVAHLRAVDVRWHPLIERAGPCRLRPVRDRFGTLVRAIISQQISTRAAATIDGRVRVLAGGPHEPSTILGLGEAGLRSCGLSGVRASYVQNLAEAVRSGQLPLKTIGRHDDQAIRDRLTAIKGIGPWTAEMFQIGRAHV